MKRRVIFIFLIIAAAVLVTIWQWLGSNNEQSEDAVTKSVVDNTQQLTANDMKTYTKPEQVIEAGKTYQAVLKTTVGNITIDLSATITPNTVNNFVFLAQEGLYDSTVFHRVIDDFMIQGGDPKGDGTGGPGYRFADEPFTGEYTRGTVAMANAGPDTNGSQFFIMHVSKPLPKNYVIFGKVSSGLDVVDAIAKTPVKRNAQGELSEPVEPVVVESVEIIEQ